MIYLAWVVLIVHGAEIHHYRGSKSVAVDATLLRLDFHKDFCQVVHEIS